MSFFQIVESQIAVILREFNYSQILSRPEQKKSRLQSVFYQIKKCRFPRNEIVNYLHRLSTEKQRGLQKCRRIYFNSRFISSYL